MRVQRLQEILEEIATADVDAEWYAVAGKRQRGLGEDLFLGHPKVGVFQVKSFAKNPFQVHGVGTRVARKIDDDLEPLFPDETSPARFGIHPSPRDADDREDRAARLQAVFEGENRPGTPDELFAAIMDAIDSPAHGPMAYEPRGRPAVLDDLTSTFDEAEALLSSELDELIHDEGVDRGFH